MLDFKPPQALGNKLDLAFAADRVVDTDDGSHRCEIFARRHFFIRIVAGEYETDKVMRRIANLLDGTRPALFIDDDRHRLRRKKRAPPYRQKQEFLRELHVDTGRHCIG